ncbi:hypothetical protein C8P68_101360 [Mucilaginibacter yixingensis]|uniref:Uncharacterized protein n=1 Tax=Mucilaginibacter yixingensis TaxID=1295612 RepID=A0A2T5JFB0_9SPHI|nr:hypothetical protein C8P68_101360 [Mucilaginibacter yixingensis]
MLRNEASLRTILFAHPQRYFAIAQYDKLKKDVMLSPVEARWEGLSAQVFDKLRLTALSFVISLL